MHCYECAYRTNSRLRVPEGRLFTKIQEAEMQANLLLSSTVVGFVKLIIGDDRYDELPNFESSTVALCFDNVT